MYHTAKQLLAQYKRAPSAESSPCLVSRQSGGMWAMTGTLLSLLENTAEKQRLSDSSTIIPTHQLPVPCNNMWLVSAIETDPFQKSTFSNDRDLGFRQEVLELKKKNHMAYMCIVYTQSYVEIVMIIALEEAKIPLWFCHGLVTNWQPIKRRFF